MIKLISTVAIASIIFIGCAEKPEERQIINKDKKISIQLEGTAYPSKTQVITSINGKVKKIHNDVGTFVKKGDILFSINEEFITKEVNQLQFEINTLENEQRKYGNGNNSRSNIAVINLSRMNLEKVANLYSQGYTSEDKFINAKNQYAIALFAQKNQEYNNQRDYDNTKQNILQKKTQLSILKDKLNNTTVKASMDGFIQDLDLYEGQQIADGAKVGTIINISKVKVKAGLATGLIPFIKKGEEVKITFITIPSYTVTVPIKRIIPLVDQELGRISVEFEVENKNYIVQSQTKAIVSIALKEKSQEDVKKFLANDSQTVLEVRSNN